jgi:hypothetical protein
MRCGTGILLAVLACGSGPAFGQEIQAFLKSGCEIAGAQVVSNAQVLVILNCKNSLRIDPATREFGKFIVVCVTKPGIGTTTRVGTQVCTEIE